MKYGLPQIEDNMRLNMGLEIPHMLLMCLLDLNMGLNWCLFILNTGLSFELA